jgi:hypothetical protein
MADRDDEDRHRTGSGWVTPGGQIRSDCLFWTSPRIRSFVPIRSPKRPCPRPPVGSQLRDPSGLFPLDRDGRLPGGDTSR